MIAAILGSRLLGPAASILAVFLFATTVGQCAAKGAMKRERDGSEAARVVAVRDLGQCQNNLAMLDAAVAEQNRAVEAFKADSAQRLAEAQKAVQQAQAAAVGARKSAAAITARRGTGDLCKSAEAVLRGAEG